MKTDIDDCPLFESTYALIVRSEERPRSVFEVLVYALLIVSTVFALSQFGSHPFTVPVAGQRSVVQFGVAGPPA